MDRDGTRSGGAAQIRFEAYAALRLSRSHRERDLGAATAQPLWLTCPKPGIELRTVGRARASCHGERYLGLARLTRTWKGRALEGYFHPAELIWLA